MGVAGEAGFGLFAAKMYVQCGVHVGRLPAPVYCLVFGA